MRHAVAVRRRYRINIADRKNVVTSGYYDGRLDCAKTGRPSEWRVVIQPLRLLSTICSVGKEHRRSFGCDRSVEHIVDVSGWSVFRNTIALARSGERKFILSSTGISFLPRFSRSRSHQHLGG
jgi:hypothetical protein